MDWQRLLESGGLFAVVLAAVGVAAWRVARFVAQDIVIPFRDVALKKLVELVDSFVAFFNATNQRHREAAEAERRHDDMLWRIHDNTEEIKGTCDRIEARFPPRTGRRPRTSPPDGGPASTGPS